MTQTADQKEYRTARFTVAKINRAEKEILQEIVNKLFSSKSKPAIVFNVSNSDRDAVSILENMFYDGRTLNPVLQKYLVLFIDNTADGAERVFAAGYQGNTLYERHNLLGRTKQVYPPSRLSQLIEKNWKLLCAILTVVITGIALFILYRRRD